MPATSGVNEQGSLPSAAISLRNGCGATTTRKAGRAPRHRRAEGAGDYE